MNDLKQHILANARQPRGEGRSLPAQAYRDPQLLEHEIRSIFEREWICVGRTLQIPNAGDYLTYDLQQHALFAIRQKDHSIKAFANVCLHRCAKLLCAANGHASRIVCPYHSWTYAIDGKLIGAPYMNETPNFTTADKSLRQLACEIWEGFVFVNLDVSAKPLAPRLAGLQKLVGPYRMADYVPVIEERETWDANWKCLVENYMDAYHIHRVHRDTFGQYGESEDVTTMLSGNGAYACHYVLADPQQRKGGDDETRRLLAHPANHWLPDPWRERIILAAIFPGHTMQLEPGMLWHLSIQPDGVDKLSVRWWVAIPGEILSDEPDPDAYVEELREFLGAVNAEDKVVVENVFQNLKSEFAHPGPLSYLEQNLFEFARYIANSMTT